LYWYSSITSINFDVVFPITLSHNAEFIFGFAAILGFEEVEFTCGGFCHLHDAIKGIFVLRAFLSGNYVSVGISQGKYLCCINVCSWMSQAAKLQRVQTGLHGSTLTSSDDALVRNVAD